MAAADALPSVVCKETLSEADHMSKYLIFTDSAADMASTVYDQYDIRIIPMDYFLNGKSVTFYTNAPDREQQCEALYQALREGAEVHTSQITPFRYLETWKPLLKDGFDILYLSFSSGMSATYTNAKNAAEELLDEYPDRRVEIVDSLSGTAGQGFLTYTAALNQEKGMSLEENAKWLREHAVLMCHRFTVGDLDFLHRGGRVSAATALIGGMLNIRPMLIIDDKGKLEVVGKARGQNAAIKSLVRDTKSQMGVEGVPNLLYITHSGVPDKVEQLIKMIRFAMGEEIKIETVNVTPILGVHTGPDFFAICTFGQKRNIK